MKHPSQKIACNQINYPLHPPDALLLYEAPPQSPPKPPIPPSEPLSPLSFPHHALPALRKLIAGQNLHPKIVKRKLFGFEKLILLHCIF